MSLQPLQDLMRYWETENAEETTRHVRALRAAAHAELSEAIRRRATSEAPSENTPVLALHDNHWHKGIVTGRPRRKDGRVPVTLDTSPPQVRYIALDNVAVTTFSSTRSMRSTERRHDYEPGRSLAL